MSKRGADEYITKEHGSTSNVSDDSKVKMATAAQLAKRKMAAPKGRLNRGGTPTGSTPSSTVSNPFASSFGGPTPQLQQNLSNTGGMMFGENKSFPPSGSTSSNGFNFSVPSSSSFTFGDQTSTVNNPFASLNGNISQQNNEPSEDAMMESPQKKPFSSSTFGFGNPGASNGVGFAGFGQNTPSAQTSQPSLFGGFGQTRTNDSGTSKPNGLFGQPSNSPASQPFSSGGFTFGQGTSSTQNSTTASPSVFGQSQTQNLSQPAAPAFSFGQGPDPVAKSPAPQSTFHFGQSSQPKQPESQSTPALFNFNSVSQPAQPEIQKPTPLFNFGQSAQSSQPSFGATASASQSTGATPFGGSQQISPVSNPFAGLSNTDRPGEKSTSLFSSAGQSTESPMDKPSTSNTNPLSGFGEKYKNKESATAANAQPASTETSKLLFGSNASSNPGKLFNTGKSDSAETQTKPLAGSVPKPSFNFGSAPAKSPSDMFSPLKAANESGSTLFNKPVEQPTAVPSVVQQTPSFSFGQSATKVPTPQAGTFQFGVKQSEPKSMAPQSSAEISNPTVDDSQSSYTKPSSNGMPDKSVDTKSVTKTAGNLLPETTTPTAQVVPPTDSEHNFSSQQPNPRRAVYTNPPARIPAYLDAEKYKSYDSNYRLHSLNREFQKRVASLDPSKEDFENIVRSYVAARESIGDSIGLYIRNTAGMKRKSDEADSQHEQPSPFKKARQTEQSTAEPSPAKFNPISSAFQPLSSSSKSATGNNPFASLNAGSQYPSSSSTKPSITPNANASTLFKNMIPEGNKGVATTQKSTSNMFANIAPTQSPSSARDQPSKTPSLFGNDSSTTKQADSTTPPSSPPKKSATSNVSQAPVFGMPKFAMAATGIDFMGAFAKKSQEASAKLAKELKEKRKLEEFDSDEEDEAEWEKKYEEEEKVKRAKLEQVPQKGFVPSFSGTKQPLQVTGDLNSSTKSNTETETDASESEASNGDGEEAESNDDHDEDEENEDDLPEDEVDTEDEGQGSSTQAAGSQNGKSLFERITRNSDSVQDRTPSSTADKASALGTSVFGANLSQSTPEPPSFSPITPSTNQTIKPSTTFNFTPLPRESPAPSPGASVFDGGALRNGPIPGEGLFGSRTSSPVNGERPKSNTPGNSAFGAFGSSTSNSGADHTWKRGSGIKFSTSDPEPPAVNITAPSPRATESFKPFSTLFGATAALSTNGPASNSLGFTFAGSGTTPAPGFLGAASHLAPSSVTSSGLSSRATSPGGTDNESVATDTEDAQDDPQASLLELRPGEENEDILFEARARAMRYYNDAEKESTGKATWNSEGLGPLRILKNRETKKSRIVLRADPGANIVLNTNLLPEVDYVAKTLQNNTGGVNMTVPKGGKFESWMLKVKTRAIADEMVAIMQKAKKPEAT